MSGLSKGIRNNRGSLLLEALMAVTILSISITLIVQSMVSSLRTGLYGADYTQALVLLENKMFEFLRQGEVESGFSEQGYFPEPYNRYQYSFGAGYSDADMQTQVNQADLKVFWKSGKRRNTIRLQTYFLNPSDEISSK